MQQTQLTQLFRHEFYRRRLQYRRDAIPGGLGDTAKASDFDREQVAKGIKVEMEHTSDPRVALEITLDHLRENPRYYDKLATLKLSRMMSMEFDRLRYAKFVESEHPRDEEGKFSEKRMMSKSILDNSTRSSFFDDMGYEDDDFELLVGAIKRGDNMEVDSYRGTKEESDTIDAIEMAVWRAAGVRSFGSSEIDPATMRGNGELPGVGPFFRAGATDDVRDGMTWFSPNRDYANNFNTYGRSVNPYAITVKNPLDLRSISGLDDVNTYLLSDLLARNGIYISGTMGQGEIHQVIQSIADELRSKAVSAGFDGIIQNENYDGKEQQTLVVFDAKNAHQLTPNNAS